MVDKIDRDFFEHFPDDMVLLETEPRKIIYNVSADFHPEYIRDHTADDIEIEYETDEQNHA